jgi:hypothetical protein
LGPLIKVEQRLNATRYLKIIANEVYPFIAAVYSSANRPCNKARIVQEWFHENYSEFSLLAVACPVTRS